MEKIIAGTLALLLNDTVDIEKDLLQAWDLRKDIDHSSGIAMSYLHLEDYYLRSSDTLRD